MGEYITEKHIAEYKEAYMMIHKNKDSRSINVKNLGQMMRSLGMNPTDVELKDMISEVDADGSGDIDFPEYLAMMVKRQKKEEILSEVEDTYQLFDINRNGIITGKDLKEVMTNMGEVITDEEIDAIMEEADPSNNGYITLDDFIKMFDTLLPPI